LDGDAANIATFAAARDHPHLFDGDEVLGIPGLSRWYPTIHVPFVRAFARITGDYGTALQAPLGLHVFLQGVGFYLFGRVLFESRYWAFLLAIVTFMRVDVNLGELWGVYSYPLPRVTFQSLLPFLAAAAYYWRATPRMWPAIMVAAGLLIYIHPVSTPAWGLALWLGFLPFLPARWSPTRSSLVMLGLGGVFFLVTLPLLSGGYRASSDDLPPRRPRHRALDPRAQRQGARVTAVCLRRLNRSRRRWLPLLASARRAPPQSHGTCRRPLRTRSARRSRT
jgi:hypothetical protein